MNKNKSKADLQEDIKKGQEQIEKVPPIEDIEDIVDDSSLSDEQKQKINEEADTASNEIKHPAS